LKVSFLSAQVTYSLLNGAKVTLLLLLYSHMLYQYLFKTFDDYKIFN